MFKKIYNKKFDKIEELTNKVDYDDLKYINESSNMATDFCVKKSYCLS